MQPRSMNSAVQVAWGGRDRETDTDRAEPRAERSFELRPPPDGGQRYSFQLYYVHTLRPSNIPMAQVLKLIRVLQGSAAAHERLAVLLGHAILLLCRKQALHPPERRVAAS